MKPAFAALFSRAPAPVPPPPVQNANVVIMGYDYDGAVHSRFTQSYDAVAWGDITTGSIAWSGVAWSEPLGLWCAVIDDFLGAGNAVATSPDGFTWTRRNAPADNYISIVWARQIAKFVAVGQDNVALSSDGITWTQHALPVVDTAWQAVFDGDGVIVVVGLPGEIPARPVATSADGQTWTARGLPGDAEESLHDVIWDETVGLWIAVGNSSAWTSPDGITWTERTIAGIGSLWSVAYSYDAGPNRSVVVNRNGGIFTSANRVTWTEVLAGGERIVPPGGGVFHRVRWSPSLGVFVLLCIGSSTDEAIFTAPPDGSVWTAQSVPGSEGSFGWQTVGTR